MSLLHDSKSLGAVMLSSVLKIGADPHCSICVVGHGLSGQLPLALTFIDLLRRNTRLRMFHL